MSLSAAAVSSKPLALCMCASAALLLSGCISVPKRDDLNGPPRTTYQSNKLPMAYAQCLTPRWQATRVVGGSAQVETVPGAGGSIRMTLRIGGLVGRVVEVVPQGSGSAIRYWNNSNDWGSGTPSEVEAIEGCR